ncbi:MAG: hypothetical protein SFU25_03230 [Candidatus Caenarcaniphilales bacterium]|nr:hypothetical protein [Candidatus Caenarcaniphilales bacterium]
MKERSAKSVKDEAEPGRNKTLDIQVGIKAKGEARSNKNERTQKVLLV